MKATLITVFLLAAATPTPAEIIDRILVVIAGQVITKSDVDASVALGLADNGLESLIDRVLMLNEVRRVVPPEPSAANVEARVSAIRKRFDSPAALGRVLSASGIDESVLRVYAADDLRLQSYLDERFSAASQPTEEEVRQAGGEAARAKLAADRRRTLVAAWVAELRRRADITVMQ